MGEHMFHRAGRTMAGSAEQEAGRMTRDTGQDREGANSDASAG